MFIDSRSTSSGKAPLRQFALPPPPSRYRNNFHHLIKHGVNVVQLHMDWYQHVMKREKLMEADAFMQKSVYVGPALKRELIATMTIN